MKKINLRHFASKPIPYRRMVDWESLLVELFVGAMLGVFGYIGYVGGLGLLFVLCTIGGVICLLSLGHRVYLYVKYHSREADS